MTICKMLNTLAEQQDEMMEQGEIVLYKGLCMQEAALLRERAHYLEDQATKEALLDAANGAMERALTVDKLLTLEVEFISQDAP